MQKVRDKVKTLTPNPLIDVLRKGFADVAEGRASREAEAVQRFTPTLAADRSKARAISAHAPHIARALRSFEARPRSAPSGELKSASGKAHVRRQYALTFVNYRCVRETDDGLSPHDEIIGGYLAIPAGGRPTSGAIPYRDRIDAGERNTFNISMYRGPAEVLSYSVELREDDSDDILHLIAGVLRDLADLWHDYVEPLLGAEDDDWRQCVAVAASVAAGTEVSDDAAGRCARYTAAMADDAVTWLADAIDSGESEYVGSQSRTFGAAELDALWPGEVKSWEDTFRGDGGEYRAALTLTALPNAKTELEDAAPSGVALASHGGNLVAAWRDPGSGMGVNLRCGRDAAHLGAKIATGATCRSGRVALADFNDRLVMAWNDDSGRGGLLVAVSSDGGKSFGAPKQVASVCQNGAISLCAHQGRLYLAWTGRQLTVNGSSLIEWDVMIASSSDGVTWSQPRALGERAFGVALASFNGRLHLAWTSTNNPSAPGVMSSADGATFDRKQTFSEQCRSVPGLAAVGGRLFISWHGTGGNTGIVSSTDGSRFDRRVVLQEQPNANRGATLAAHAGNLYVAWSDRDSGRVNLLPYL